MNQPLLINYRNVTVHRAGRTVIDRLNLTIPVGENVAICGPNGCGKSTLIKTITRELYPDPEVPDSFTEIYGKRTWNIFDLRHIMGIVSYDWLQLCTRDYPSYEIVLSGFHGSVGIWYNHIVTPEMEQRARQVMEELEISHLADRPTEELSSGESRRVLIARALVHQPPNVLLDEPTSGLDVMSTRAMRDFIRRLRDQGRCVVFSSHIMQEVSALCDNIVIINRGLVVASGAPEDLLAQTGQSNLEDAFVAAIGSEEGLVRA